MNHRPDIRIFQMTLSPSHSMCVPNTSLKLYSAQDGLALTSSPPPSLPPSLHVSAARCAIPKNSLHRKVKIPMSLQIHHPLTIQPPPKDPPVKHTHTRHASTHTHTQVQKTTHSCIVSLQCRSRCECCLSFFITHNSKNITDTVARNCNKSHLINSPFCRRKHRVPLLNVSSTY